MTDLQEPAASDPTAALSVPLISRRRELAKWVQKFQHAVPAVFLLSAGARGLMQGERGLGLALAVGELTVSFLLLRTMMKGLKAAWRPHSGPTGHHHGVDWFDIFAAGVLTVEALEHWYTHPHLPRPKFLMAIVTLALGLFHGRIAAFHARRRMLSIDATGIGVRSRPIFRRFFAPWPEIERIDIDDRKARIVTRGGRERRIDLKDLRNAPEVREALLAARQRLAPAPAPPA